MPRKAREKSRTGIYHVMLRGVNGKIIFETRIMKNFFKQLKIIKSSVDIKSMLFAL